MNYFTSGIYGNKELYMSLKSMLRKDDVLWILGDVLDGNIEKPWECFEILDDIDRSPNIHLIAGDHEYFHTMRILTETNEDLSKSWEQELFMCDISGEPLIDYMNSMDPDDLYGYILSLSKKEVSEMVKIGDRLFYLCHGAPTLRMNVSGGDMAWQYGVTTGKCDFNATYQAEITSDIHIAKYDDRFSGIDISKCHVITAHIPVFTYENEGIESVDGIIYKNKKFCIHQGFDTTEDHYLLAVDAAGFFTKKIKL